jgi:hypothetical protein
MGIVNSCSADTVVVVELVQEGKMKDLATGCEVGRRGPVF